MRPMELQFITHFTDSYSYYDSACMALEGGCRWIQLRMKDAPVSEVEQEALRLQHLCRDYGATFIIDDHVELLKKIHADGVHLGKKDMPVAEARKMLGKDFIIGGTANTFEDVKMHYEAGADYIGCGPFRFTTTKKKPLTGIGTGRISLYRLADERSRYTSAHRCHRRHNFRRYSLYHGNRCHRDRSNSFECICLILNEEETYSPTVCKI